ncbi:MAG TPA: hypothetical protein VKH37_08865 [Ferruginibacter sp.]|nr:hypothetical protein [Ferruginibacter sp.]
MKHPIVQLILAMSASILLCVLTFSFFDSLVDILLPKVDGGHYSVTHIAGPSHIALSFSIVLGLFPISIFLVWKFAPIISSGRRLISIGIVILAMAITVVCRREMIKGFFSNKPDAPTINDIRLYYPVEQTHYEYYLMAGLCAGLGICFFALRPRGIV